MTAGGLFLTSAALGAQPKIPKTPVLRGLTSGSFTSEQQPATYYKASAVLGKGGP